MPVHFFRVGKGARFQITATNFLVESANGIEQWDDLDGMNTESGGVEEGDVGGGVVVVDLNVFWQVGTNWFGQFAPPAGIGALGQSDNKYGNSSVTAVGCNIKLFINVNDVIFWAFPIIKLLSIGTQKQVRRLIMVPIKFKSNGYYFRPDGTQVGF